MPDLRGAEGTIPFFHRIKSGAARVTLEEGKKNNLFPEGGTAVVIHRDPEDYLTDPAGADPGSPAG
jgi:Cu/Zn superoxide dismutase